MLRRFWTCFFILAAMALLPCCNNKAVKIPISDFFKTPEKSFFKISPDGKYVAYLKPYKERQNLFIESLADGTERMATSFEDYPIRDYYWTFNNQIVFLQDLIAADQYKMYSLDVATLKVKTIIVTGTKGRIRILSRNRAAPDILNIAMNKRDAANFDIYRLNIKTGELGPYLVNPGNITEWYPDPDGRIRLVKTSDGVDEAILYRPDDTKPFKKIIVNNFKTRVAPIAFTGVKNYFYALSNVNRDKTALVEINAETGNEEKVIYANDKADLQGAEYSKSKRCIEFAWWEEAYPKKQFLDSGMAGIYSDLAAKLKGNEIRIIDKDSAENKFIVNNYTERSPGEFYLFERN